MQQPLLLAQVQPQPVPPPPASVALPPADPLSIAPPPAPEGFLDQLLAFVYTLAHWAGQLIVMGLDNLLTTPISQSLVDPIGYLALLTVFLIIAEVAKKVTWIIVIVGWVLIGVRVALEIAGKT